MKKICYQTLMETERAGERTLHIVELRCPDSALEANLAIARAEAYESVYTVEDVPDEAADSAEATWDELAAAYEEGVCEA